MQPNDSPVFSPSAYDENMSLTPGGLFWLVNAFILRPFIVLIASISDRNDRFGLLNLLYPDHQWALYHAAAALPALAVVIAYTRRTPTAGNTIRRLWRSGLALILASLALNVALLALPWLMHGGRLGTPALGQIIGCVLAAYLLLRSPRVRQSFADFPAPPPPAPSTNATT